MRIATRFDAQQESAPRLPAPQRRQRWRVAMIGLLAVLAVIAAIAAARTEERLRLYLERQVNAALTGYTVSIGTLELHVLGLAVELENVTVVQDARPSPPMLDLPSWRTSVEWRSLLSFALVADTVFDRPTVFITLEQSKTEARDPVPVTDRGWQDALQAVYPLKINSLRIVEGDVLYYDGNLPPIQLQRVQFRATNIRNVQSAPGAYPSPVELRASVLGGSLTANGGADFFAADAATEPGTRVDLRDVHIRGGSLTLAVDALRSADGRTVYAQAKELPPLRLDDLDFHATNLSSQPRAKAPPTRFELRARALDNGHLTLTGTTDLLAQPTPTAVADFELRRMRLKPFAPLAAHWAFVLDGGELGALGRLTIDRTQTALLLRRIVATNPVVSYVQRTAADERRIERATRAATDAQPAPAVRVDVDDARIRGGRFTFVDAAADPRYTLALTQSDVAVRGFSRGRSRTRTPARGRSSSGCCAMPSAARSFPGSTMPSVGADGTTGCVCTKYPDPSGAWCARTAPAAIRQPAHGLLRAMQEETR